MAEEPVAKRNAIFNLQTKFEGKIVKIKELMVTLMIRPKKCISPYLKNCFNFAGPALKVHILFN